MYYIRKGPFDFHPDAPEELMDVITNEHNRDPKRRIRVFHGVPSEGRFFDEEPYEGVVEVNNGEPKGPVVAFTVEFEGHELKRTLGIFTSSVMKIEVCETDEVLYDATKDKT